MASVEKVSGPHVCNDESAASAQIHPKINIRLDEFWRKGKEGMVIGTPQAQVKGDLTSAAEQCDSDKKDVGMADALKSQDIQSAMDDEQSWVGSGWRWRSLVFSAGGWRRRHFVDVCRRSGGGCGGCGTAGGCTAQR